MIEAFWMLFFTLCYSLHYVYYVNLSLRTKIESASSGGNVPGIVPIELCLVVVFVVVGFEV